MYSLPSLPPKIHLGTCFLIFLRLTGDGAGILVNIPDDFFRKELKQAANIDLPPVRNYAVAAFFLDKEDKKQLQAKEIVESVLSSKKYK